ncbi:MAG TPA: tetratricopeptide repeat protein [Blastocatellia bacterium]|nr:tetratricopeptide repeat protein [Blastocatellia bacterium]
MKAIRFSRIFLILASLAVVSFAAFGIRATLSRTQPLDEAHRTLSPVSAGLTIADKQMQKGEAMIKRAPSEPDGYNLLCAAYIQKARDTGDFTFNAKAETALNHSFAVSADNYDAIKLKATLLLTYHRFGEALEVARRARDLQPKDHTIYGALTDALVELGRYDEARDAVETMIRLKPDASSYARLSYIYSLGGDTDGAIEVMRAAVKSSTRQDAEGYAWYRTHLGDELMKAGKLKEGEREFDFALEAFPNYHIALAAKARARVAANDLGSAVELYKQSQERVPLPDTAIALGDLYAKLGRMDEARKQYELVEFIEQSSNAGAATYSRQLALFWANHDKKLDDALRIAQSERAARADIYTCDVLAWCLYKTNDLKGAKAAIDEALRLGTRDALLHYHAGMIYAKLGDQSSAIKHLSRALEINPSFDVLQADAARQKLEELQTRK